MLKHNAHAHLNLVPTMLFERCFQAPYIYFCINSSTGNVFSIRKHDHIEEFFVMQEGIPDLLIRLEIPDASGAVS